MASIFSSSSVVIAGSIEIIMKEHSISHSYSIEIYDMSLVLRKLVFGVSDQVQHKPGCTATEDGQRLEILDLGSRWIVLCV